MLQLCVRRVAVLALTLAAVLVAASQAFAAKGIIIGGVGTGGGSSGKIVDDKTGEEVLFFQPHARELGLVPGSEVTFERVVPSGQKDPVAVLVHLQRRSPLPEESGRVIAFRTDGSGVAEVRKTGARFAFTQPFSAELGLGTGV